MADFNNDTVGADFGRQTIEKFLDAECQVNPDCLGIRGWKALPVADAMNPIEAEWIAHAILQIGKTEIAGISFEFSGEPFVQGVNADRDSILRYIGENSYRYALLTDARLQFLVFKDQQNRYFLLCGTDNFLSNAYPCSRDAARMVFEDWANDEFQSPAEREVLVSLWNKYAGHDSCEEH